VTRTVKPSGVTLEKRISSSGFTLTDEGALGVAGVGAG
jgi:hypothetical protein